MNKILDLLKKYEARHKKYNNRLRVVLYDDGSGKITTWEADSDIEIESFESLEDFKNICLHK